MILREPNIRIPTCNSLGDIAMSYSKTAGEVLDLVGEDGIGCGLADQGFNGRNVAGARCRLDCICFRKARARSRHIGKPVDAERITLTDEECTTAILRENTRLRFDGAKPAQ